MKLLIVALACFCYVGLAFGNFTSYVSGAVLIREEPKDEYKLATDSKSADAAAVTFSHINHATKNYSVDGTKPIGCIECHHTEQPAAEVVKTPPYKTAHPADRTTTLTAATSKDMDVVECRACHAQSGETPKLMKEIPKYTLEGESDEITLTNEEAYHKNCAGCHEAAAAARKSVKAPTYTDCAACHTGK